MKYWCSDIDGVLIDSRELVHESYRRVGVNMPESAWGHPWKTWLPAAVGSYDLAKQLHDEKTKEYIEVLKSGTVPINALPLAHVMTALEQRDDTQVYYVTGASLPVAQIILSELGLNTDALLAAGISTDDRYDIMKTISSSGTYVDDRVEGRYPALRAGWDFVWAKQEIFWKQ